MSPFTAEPEIDEVAEDFYPCSDGQPMGETFLHVQALINLYDVFTYRYRERTDSLVAADLFWYWERGNRAASTAPDLMIVFGVTHQQPRRSYKLWKENGVVPAVIFEVASENTWRLRLYDNREQYERLGVREYFLFDPEDRYLPEQLMGFRLEQGRYQEIALQADDSMYSEVLNLTLRPVGRFLRAFDPLSKEMLLTGREDAEKEHRLRQEEQRLLEEAEKQAIEAEKKADEAQRLRAEAEKKADEELRLRTEAEKQIDELRAQLAKLLAERSELPPTNG